MAPGGWFPDGAQVEMMDRNKALGAFRAYAEGYDINDIKIKLKIDHTYRVAAFADRIAGPAGADRDFSWFLGLLHDIGRFEQQTRYGTFVDASSVDHAELGADILFKGVDGNPPLIGAFSGVSFPGLGADRWKSIAEAAIRLHNKLDLPEGLDGDTFLYSNILRDADKVDIFRVLTEPPYDERMRRVAELSETAPTPAREEVMLCIKVHRFVPRSFEKTEFEKLLSICCMGFELIYPESQRMVSEQGYFHKLMDIDLQDGRMRRQLETLRSEIAKAWYEEP